MTKVDIKRIIKKMHIKGVCYNEPADISYIRKLESDSKVRFPIELVKIYSEVCNGCVMIDGFKMKRIEEWNISTSHIKNVFQFEKYWVWEDNYDEEKVKKTQDGNIELIDTGDAQSWNIVVNGKQSGYMWFFTSVGIQPCDPPLSVMEWFEFWLDGYEDYFKAF